jgi:hypothetical protein
VLRLTSIVTSRGNTLDVATIRPDGEVAGPPVLLLHPINMRKECWLGLLPVLAGAIGLGVAAGLPGRVLSVTGLGSAIEPHPDRHPDPAGGVLGGRERVAGGRTVPGAVADRRARRHGLDRGRRGHRPEARRAPPDAVRRGPPADDRGRRRRAGAPRSAPALCGRSRARALTSWVPSTTSPRSGVGRRGIRGPARSGRARRPSPPTGARRRPRPATRSRARAPAAPPRRCA